MTVDVLILFGHEMSPEAMDSFPDFDMYGSVPFGVG